MYEHSGHLAVVAQFLGLDLGVRARSPIWNHLETVVRFQSAEQVCRFSQIGWEVPGIASIRGIHHQLDSRKERGVTAQAFDVLVGAQQTIVEASRIGCQV